MLEGEIEVKTYNKKGFIPTFLKDKNKLNIRQSKFDNNRNFQSLDKKEKILPHLNKVYLFRI